MEKDKLLLLKEKIDAYIEMYYEPIIFEESACLSKACGAPTPFDEFETEPTFQEILFKFIDSKNLDEVEVYKKADIDRKLFSKIRSNVDYNPKKQTVIKFIFGLELDLDEADELLESAGYSLSRSIKKDVIIEYFIRNKMYNLDDLNQALYEYDEIL